MHYLFILLSFSLLSLTSQEIDREKLHACLDEALDKIEEIYPGDIDQTKLMQDILKSVVQSVDKNADYLDQNQLNSIRSLFNGKSKGLGISIEKCFQGFKVMKVFEGSNAEKEGIKTNDILFKLDEFDLKNFSCEQLIQAIKDERPYLIKIKRKNKALTKIISPSIYSFSSLNLRWIKDVAYIKVSFIQDNAEEEMCKIIESIKKRSKVKGVILDIRNAPGGSLLAASKIACLFLDGDLVINLQSKTDKSSIISSGPDQLKNIPIVVLQNRNTCSAAEIISASLKASNRAKIIGENSAGAATAKLFLPLQDKKGALMLTYAFLYDKNEKIIGTDGISPNILLKEIKESSSTDYDSQIDESLKFLN